jgi:hypothetical protein
MIMTKLIEIQEYPIKDCYKVVSGGKHVILQSHKVNSLLSMRQKEEFFMGKFRFKVSEYDLRQAGL